MARPTRSKSADPDKPSPSLVDPDVTSQADAVTSPQEGDLLRSLDANTAAIKELTTALNQVARQCVTVNLSKGLEELQPPFANQPADNGINKAALFAESFTAQPIGQGLGPQFNILAALKDRSCFNDPNMDGNTSLLKYTSGNPAAVTSVVMGRVNNSPIFQKAGVQVRSNDCTYLYYVQNLIDKIACIMSGMC